ncbi:MAG: NUDIX domain-containing protein [Nanoarchaeota archaeon]|nr:NUDIX domain-containing protein [Nanoarchaeota archaeon]
MTAPKNPEKRKYMFTDDMKFLQKIVIYNSKQDKFLVLKRPANAHSRPNCWDLPGGNVLFRENYLDSLTREVVEETSLKIKNVRPIQVVTNFENRIYYLFIGYSCRAASSRVKISKEHSEYKWVTKAEFLRLESANFLIDLVKQL